MTTTIDLPGLPPDSTPLQVASWMLTNGMWLADAIDVQGQDGQIYRFERRWDATGDISGSWSITGRRLT